MEDIEQACKVFMLSRLCADTAHDLTHTQRVVKVAKELAAKVGADLEVVIPAAWLHDCVAVAKNHPDRSKASKFSADKAIEFLKSINYQEGKLSSIHHTIVAHSFSANVPAVTLEAKVVQDADRMDALGAIGVSRCMKVGGAIARNLYHSDDPFCEDRKAEDMKYTLDHVFINLLQIADNMQTETAKAEARIRTAFMRNFLEQLKQEITP